MALGAMGSIVALLAHSVFEFQMYIPANVLTLAWIAGIGCGVSPPRLTRPSRNQTRDSATPATRFLTVAARKGSADA
jgi:hypothetical protein